MGNKDFIDRHCLPCVQQTFFRADILIYHSRKSTGVINNVNNAAGLFKCPRRPLLQRHPFIVHSEHFLRGVWNRFYTCAFTMGTSNIITDICGDETDSKHLRVCAFFLGFSFLFSSHLVMCAELEKGNVMYFCTPIRIQQIWIWWHVLGRLLMLQVNVNEIRAQPNSPDKAGQLWRLC